MVMLWQEAFLEVKNKNLNFFLGFNQERFIGMNVVSCFLNVLKFLLSN